ncbi:MAG: Hpt domain-containing protein [Planctomycetaceae bacterium]
MSSLNPFVAGIRKASLSLAGFFKQASPAAAEPPPFTGPPLHILCADDIPVNQSLISNILRKCGHRVEIVGDGRAAAERARHGPYDIILMELQMPVMARFFREDAPALLDRIRDGIHRRDSSAVVLAAHTLKGTAALCGGMRAAKVASQLESLGHDEDSPALAAALPRLKAALTHLDDALAQA